MAKLKHALGCKNVSSCLNHNLAIPFSLISSGTCGHFKNRSKIPLKSINQMKKAAYIK